MAARPAACTGFRVWFFSASSSAARSWSCWRRVRRLARGPIWRRRRGGSLAVLSGGGGVAARSRSYLAAACDGSLAVLSGGGVPGGVHGVPLVVLTHPLVIVESSSEGFLSGVLWFSASKHPARIGLSLRTVYSLAFHLDSGRVVPLVVLLGGGVAARPWWSCLAACTACAGFRSRFCFGGFA